MGNAVASSRGARPVKIMKLDGQVLHFNSTLTVDQLLRNYPNHVILHSEAVRHMGLRAKPLEGSMQLSPKQLYFLIEKPMIEDLRVLTRVRSVINMSAKSRLEAMYSVRRSTSDVSAITSTDYKISANPSSMNKQDGGVRVKVRLTKAQLDQLTAESENSSETASKILELCLNDAEAEKSEKFSQNLIQNMAVGNSHESCTKTPRKRVRFSCNVQSAEVF